MSGSDLDKRVNRTLHQLREDQYLGVFPDYRPMEEVAADAAKEVVPAPSFQMEFDGASMMVSLPRNLTRGAAAMLVSELLDLYDLILVDVTGFGRAKGSQLVVSYFQDSPTPKEATIEEHTQRLAAASDRIEVLAQRVTDLGGFGARCDRGRG
jgi:hypothetical protein